MGGTKVKWTSSHGEGACNGCRTQLLEIQLSVSNDVAAWLKRLVHSTVSFYELQRSFAAMQATWHAFSQFVSNIINMLRGTTAQPSAPCRTQAWLQADS